MTDQAEILDALATAEIDVIGRMPWSSNGTYLVQLGERPTDVPDGDDAGLGSGPRAIYKPARGERPLWDFPNGLFRREVSAYVLSSHLGWDLVPPTIERDGPLGTGSLQWFVDAEFEQHYLSLRERPELAPAFQRLCAFDIVTNNTDRKSGHCLLQGERVWAIDNGLSFHAEFKLRTVIWDFAGDPIPSDILADLDRLLDGELPDYVAESLTVEECQALRRRARALRTAGCFPIDESGRRWPWPMV